MATVPKGIAHRSHSTLWSVVMLLEGIFPFTRRDGDRRMPVASGDEAHLEQVNLAEESRKLYQPFTPVNLIAVDDFMMRMILVQGEGRPHRHQKRSELFFVHEGVVQLQTEEGDVTLEEGEITVVPREVEHRLVAGDRAILLLFARS
ncbi:MAG: cupin domain-containing protein [Anaerolineae bacterium]